MTESSKPPRRRKPAVKKAAAAPIPQSTSADLAVSEATTTASPPVVVTPPKATKKAPEAPSPAPTNDVVCAMMKVPIELRWRDLDAFNHVNNSSYLTFLEEARLRWLATIDGEWFFEDSLPVLASVNLNYRRPLPWPAQIVVELSCQRLGGSSMTIAHRIVDASDSKIVYCDGQVVMVWMNPGAGTSTPLPAAIRKACAG